MTTEDNEESVPTTVVFCVEKLIQDAQKQSAIDLTLTLLKRVARWEAWSTFEKSPRTCDLESRRKGRIGLISCDTNYEWSLSGTGRIYIRQMKQELSVSKIKRETRRQWVHMLWIVCNHQVDETYGTAATNPAAVLRQQTRRLVNRVVRYVADRYNPEPFSPGVVLHVHSDACKCPTICRVELVENNELVFLPIETDERKKTLLTALNFKNEVKPFFSRNVQMCIINDRLHERELPRVEGIVTCPQITAKCQYIVGSKLLCDGAILAQKLYVHTQVDAVKEEMLEELRDRSTFEMYKEFKEILKRTFDASTDHGDAYLHIFEFTLMVMTRGLVTDDSASYPLYVVTDNNLLENLRSLCGSDAFTLRSNMHVAYESLKNRQCEGRLVTLAASLEQLTGSVKREFARLHKHGFVSWSNRAGRIGNRRMITYIKVDCQRLLEVGKMGIDDVRIIRTRLSSPCSLLSAQDVGRLWTLGACFLEKEVKRLPFFESLQEDSASWNDLKRHLMDSIKGSEGAKSSNGGSIHVRSFLNSAVQHTYNLFKLQNFDCARLERMVLAYAKRLRNKQTAHNDSRSVAFRFFLRDRRCSSANFLSILRDCAKKQFCIKHDLGLSTADTTSEPIQVEVHESVCDKSMLPLFQVRRVLPRSEFILKK
ncbi:hypothetical protein CYMTET_55212 [Cymbomonas tetramitiformis]|uniref:Uncharacterized protein n=1 Tax=Cymbomonas tetramitiformis TaxID=36881 RepID=A0AAE0BDY4_9CHLO|nr:hypothetical protein CYMTET_55212 [Cymbomonas tetramitiformis]